MLSFPLSAAWPPTTFFCPYRVQSIPSLRKVRKALRQCQLGMLRVDMFFEGFLRQSTHETLFGKIHPTTQTETTTKQNEKERQYHTIVPFSLPKENNNNLRVHPKPCKQTHKAAFGSLSACSVCTSQRLTHSKLFFLSHRSSPIRSLLSLC